MSRKNPPRRLPRAYHEIWRALREADEGSPSRQVLARELGVATHTLQRLLVRGDVPSFGKGTSTRVRRAWARTLARLAQRLGRDPRAWVESAGIEWTPDIARAVTTALDSAAARGRGAPAASPWRERQADRTFAKERVGTISVSEEGKHGARAGLVQRPKIAIVRGSPLGVPLPGRDASFLEVYGRRMMGAVSPRNPVDCVVEGEDEALCRLAAEPAALAVVAGAAQTTARKASGFRFSTIPGWRVRLGAVVAGGRPDRTAARSWRALAEGEPGVVMAVVDEVAGDYLAGQHGLAVERIQVSATDPGFADEIAGRLGSAGASHVVLVGLEGSCREALRVLAACASPKIEAGWLSDLPPVPSYPVAVAVRGADAQWAELMDGARDDEFFGGEPEAAGRLYAEVAATGAAPVHFAAASLAFQKAFCERVADLLSEEEPADSLLQDAARIASRAVTLVPPEWREALEAALERLPSRRAREALAPSGASRFCISCSAALEDEHNRGVSDRYCRFCADEAGRLRPKDEVRRLIAGWIGEWQGLDDEAEMLHRADRLMSTMPAWSRN